MSRRWRVTLFILSMVAAAGALSQVHKMPRTLAAFRFAFDLLPDLAAIFLALVLAAAGLALLFLPEELKRLEDQRRLRVIIATVLLAIGVVFGGGGVVSDLVQKHEDKTAAAEEKTEAKKERDKLTDQIGELIKQQQLAHANQEILQAQLNTVTEKNMPELLGGVKQIANPKAGPKPDVSLRFVYPKSPALMIVNRSDVLAREIKWEVALWNVDLPDRNDPLPIPVAVFDWLIKGKEGGPMNLFDTPNVASLLKPGNRLLGSASVMCPECIRGRTFLVYLIWNEGGWFSELPEATSGTVYIPTNFSKDYREAYFRMIEAIPNKSRIPIAGR
jgi:hypothetical protein